MKDIKYQKRLESNKKYKRNNPDKVKEYKRRYYQKHKNIIQEKKKKYFLENPEKVRRWKLNPYYKKYKDFSLNKYDELFKKQNGVCAICKLPELNKNLAVDHCHSTGIVRGLLCQKCNRGIGLFNDSVKLLHLGAEYLNKNH